MKRTVIYFQRMDEKAEIEYDDEAPCITCGELVVSASMGGTVICPWCDTGHCRYCGIRIMVFKEEIDGGESLRNLREHMRWHRDRDPDFNKKALEVSRLAEARMREEDTKILAQKEVG